MSESPESLAFTSLALKAPLLEGLAALDYREMTPIQAATLPSILDGSDLIGQGKTGSGKTAAFGLGVLSALDVASFDVQGLVLCPTRELADQVAEELRRLARRLPNVKILSLCGGAPIGPQLNSLAHGAHVVVGTPGRIEDHLRKGALDLSRLRALVLDEADRMLEMGFKETLEAIVAATPASRQTLLFSATYGEAVKPVAERMLKTPRIVEVESTHDDQSIRQSFHGVADEASRLPALCRLLLHHRPASSVVFCNTRKETQTVAEGLDAAGFSASPLHGDLDQRERDQTLIRFANGSLSILVATDVAARGLDIDALDAVFNYQIARELEVHVHRVGRTGRAGAKGLACTLVGERETYRLEKLAAYLERPLTLSPLPAEPKMSQPFTPAMATIQIDAGKKQKIRPGDILGALTQGDEALVGGQVGKIKVLDRASYVAVERTAVKSALQTLANGKLKGRSCRARRIGR
ncbi:ATP-dependent RNA helicase DbpA [Salinicola rhizosphaerae]|uniref:ATP-dependent RNA helicase n=1 Tax=Salinicola rhizosphaerae TaxID=1443141 RepID=A0ABQ3DZE9_9GAMM|nr:ATP-dependent RNA helicase DbpA [Salinicola rhizosphaerae]GHB21256.1 ATP-dependent RNA helicase [Salinicola rhizosphaerae]